MKTFLKIILLLISISAFSQENKALSKSTTRKLYGTWAQTKIIGEEFPVHDTILLKKDKTYTWINGDGRQTGKWYVDNYKARETDQVYSELLNLEDLEGTSKGAMYIYTINSSTLVFRIPKLAGNASEGGFIEMHFKKLR